MDSAHAPVTIDQLLAHADWVRGLARALTADEASADDVAQETWLASLERPPRGSEQLKHWLAVVTRNVARRLLRKQKSDAALERAAARGEASEPGDDVVARAALQQRVVAAVMRLAEPYRSTLLQRFFDGRPPRAIAAAAGVPVETVKTRLKRGLELVRRDLAGEFEREGRAWPAAVLLLKRLAQPAAPATLGAAIGVVVMTKGVKLAIVAAVVLAAAPAAWWIMNRTKQPARTDVTAVKSAATPPLAPPPVANATEVVRTAEERSAERRETAAPATEAIDSTATGTIRGRVVDLEDRPVAGAVVYAGDQRENSFRDHDQFVNGINGPIQDSYPPIFKARATTAADGKFELAGLDRQRTWSVGTGTPLAGCAFASPFRFEGAELTRSVELRCEGGVSFVGKCTEASGAAHRLSMVMISVKKDEPSLRPNVYADYVLNPGVQFHDDGTFQTMAVPGHWFTVQASAFPESKPNSLEPEEGGFKEIRIPWTRIPDSQHEWRLDLKFEKVVGLSGRIVAEDGSPAHLGDRLVPELSEAELARQSRETIAVVAFQDDPRRDASVLRSVYYDSGGSFSTGANHAYGKLDLDHDLYTVERPPAAAKFVALIARNELLGCAEISGATGPDLPVDLALLPEEPLVRTVRFTATSALDGKPLDYVQLQFECYPAAEPVRGYGQSLSEPLAQRMNLPITHTASLPVGTAVISVYRNGWMRDRLVAEIPPGDSPLELTLALTPEGKASILGEVVDEDGKPLADAPLRLYRRSDVRPICDPSRRTEGRTDVAGRFEFRDLPAADYVVAVDPYEFHPESGRELRDERDLLRPTAIVLAASESPQSCRLALARGVACTLDVTFADGVNRPVRLRAFDGAGLPLIDDSNHGWSEYWRSSGRLDVILPNSKTKLELRGRTGEPKTIEFDPALSTTASIILPAN